MIKTGSFQWETDIQSSDIPDPDFEPPDGAYLS
jgi:hypothetical protein